MKVGAISLMTVLMLAWPLVAFAGTGPCPSPDSDTDGDGVCDIGPPADNCKDTPNASQTDTDGDGQGDVCDNCISVANGPNTGSPLYPGKYGPYDPTHPTNWGQPTPGLQCDTNWDGYGNACDPDLNGDNFATATDYTGQFAPGLAAGFFVWKFGAVGGTLVFNNGTTTSQEVDQNCDNFTQATDYTGYFAPGIASGFFMSGRSGITTGAAGCCPPHN